MALRKFGSHSLTVVSGRMNLKACRACDDYYCDAASRGRASRSGADSRFAEAQHGRGAGSC